MEDLNIDGWYRLAAKVVTGVTDPEEQEEWRLWARERHRPAKRHRLRTVQPSDLWNGAPPVQRAKRQRNLHGVRQDGR